MTFTPFAKYFDFYSLQHQVETVVFWISFPFLCYIVYKLFIAMTE